MKKIVITGPESTGKTTLAAALAERTGEEYTPEFARYYVAHLGRPYQRGDLVAIAKGQKIWEEWYATRAKNRHWCDTDWTVLHVWETYRFENGLLNTPAPLHWRRGYGTPAPADLYLLCAPDFPWMPDPLREHPDEQTQLFERYKTLLTDYNAPFVILTGTLTTRINTVLDILD
jgi:nicotinamide riboside kinase